jgi:hypothetical protein
MAGQDGAAGQRDLEPGQQHGERERRAEQEGELAAAPPLAADRVTHHVLAGQRRSQREREQPWHAEQHVRQGDLPRERARQQEGDGQVLAEELTRRRARPTAVAEKRKHEYEACKDRRRDRYPR